MRWRCIRVAIWVLGLLLADGHHLVPHVDAQGLTEPTPQVGWVVQDFVAVHAGPGAEYPLVWRLYEGSQVVALGEQLDAQGTAWREVSLWNSQTGWLEAALLSFEALPPAPVPSGGGGPGPCPPASAGSALQPLEAVGTTTQANPLDDGSDGTVPQATLGPGTEVRVDAWQVGGDGRARYHVQAGPTAGWAAPGSVALQAADAASRQLRGASIAAPLAGTGLWFTLDSRQHGLGAGQRVAEAARAAGLSHLYVEVATSRGGFFGGPWLDELLPAARAAGLRVIGSVYTCLDDLPADLTLAVEVARYRTPDGLSLDGLTADIEEQLVPENVQAFGELLRHALGDDALLVATIYPPDSWAAPHYPWRALGASWSAVAPMAYWGQPRPPADVYAYTQRTLAGVRALAGRPDLPVELLGQLFELGQPRLLGPDPPSAAEVVAAASAARAGGAIGISFFDWARATPAHWQALATFRW